MSASATARESMPLLQAAKLSRPSCLADMWQYLNERPFLSVTISSLLGSACLFGLSIVISFSIAEACGCPTSDHRRAQSIAWVTAVMASLSTIACCCMGALGFYAACVFATVGTTKTSLSIINMLVLTDGLYSLQLAVKAVLALARYDAINNFYRAHETMDVTTACIASTWLAQFFGAASLSWSAVLSTFVFLHLYWCGVYGKMSERARFIFIVSAHVYVWTVALVTCLIAQLGHHIGYTKDATTCFLVGQYVWTFYVPLLVSIASSVSVLVYFAYAFSGLRRVAKDSADAMHNSIASQGAATSVAIRSLLPQRTAQEEVICRMIMWVVFRVMGWTIPTMVDLMQSQNPPMKLQLLHDIWLSAIGIIDALVWATIIVSNFARVGCVDGSPATLNGVLRVMVGDTRPSVQDAWASRSGRESADSPIPTCRNSDEAADAAPDTRIERVRSP